MMSATQQMGIFQQPDKGDFPWPRDSIRFLTALSLHLQWLHHLKN
jgi:hypothetical protein